MANTTDKSILTAAGKALLAQLNAEEKPLIIDKMIFANVPNRPEYPQPDDVVPTDHVVHQEGVEQRGRLTADSVIYSTTLTSGVGPFEFNWTGAYCSEHGVLVTIDHHALTPKTADEPGVAGNTLVRSVVLEYKDIAEITNITVDASSWQYNATPRMKKMDEDVAQAIIDQNGKDWFIEDGFLVTPSGSAYSIKAGGGYVSGNRVAMEFDRSVQVPNKPSFIYIDAHREGTPTGEQVTLFDFVITAEEKDDYIDVNGVKHFVCKIAQVLGDGTVVDMRKKQAGAQQWEEGKVVTDPRSRYEYKSVDAIREGLIYYAPNASLSNPVVMGEKPVLIRDGGNFALWNNVVDYQRGFSQEVAIGVTVEVGVTDIIYQGEYYVMSPASVGVLSAVDLVEMTAVIGEKTVNLWPSNSRYTVPNVDFLKSASYLKPGDKCYTSGYYEPNDGGAPLSGYQVMERIAYQGVIDNLGKAFEIEGTTLVAVMTQLIAIKDRYYGVKPGDDSHDDYPHLQAAVNALRDFDTLTLSEGLSPQSVVVIPDGTDNYTIQYGSVDWNHTGNHVFELQGTQKKPNFLGIDFTSKNYGARKTMGAIGCASGVNTTDWLVDQCTFDGVPFGVYFNADEGGTHTNPKTSRCTYKNSPHLFDLSKDEEVSGCGLGAVFAATQGTIVNGISEYNTYDNNARHGLYSSAGGNVTSIGDTITRHRKSVFEAGKNRQELAGIQLARIGGNCRIIYPTTRDNYDTAISVTGVMTEGETTNTVNVSVLYPQYLDDRGLCLRVGNDSPAQNGVLHNFTQMGASIVRKNNDAGNTCIAVLSGINLNLGKITVELRGTVSNTRIVRVYGYGDDTQFNNLECDGISGVDYRAGTVGVYVDTRVCLGSAALKLFGEYLGGIVYQSTPTNPNITEGAESFIIQAYPAEIEDPNGVVTARPGTVFLSNYISGSKQSRMWIKESTYGDTGWVMK
ncbi:phage tail-collar fiber domain-containing protein [Vibrio vulnificus]|uniref:phage tail-collar fiber domain-containing protein n=1 Tax=Vibrio vulnificus TaxID=672 RepID=UPI001CDBF224|nr:phage tail protein [Vibrio vulnificus]